MHRKSSCSSGAWSELRRAAALTTHPRYYRGACRHSLTHRSQSLSTTINSARWVELMPRATWLRCQPWRKLPCYRRPCSSLVKKHQARRRWLKTSSIALVWSTSTLRNGSRRTSWRMKTTRTFACNWYKRWLWSTRRALSSKTSRRTNSRPNSS